MPDGKIVALIMELLKDNSNLTAPLQDGHWIIGKVSSSIGDIPKISTKLTRADRIGSYKARWAIGRMNYRVRPGLYAAGQPDEKSPVFVSANYKMSFDRLRSSLDGLDCWIMVIDTKGINVWCAAGKGTFGTDEIVLRAELTRLGRVVSHRRLIVPQLGAPGIAAHEVKKRSGFRIIYGPIRAEDIKQFLADGLKANPEMRQVRFNFIDRAVLIPCDLIQSLKYFIPAAVVLFVLSGLGPNIFSIERMVHNGPANVLILTLAYIIGNSLPPLLLPYLPGRAFAVKGASLGLPVGIAVFLFFSSLTGFAIPNLSSYAWIIMITSLISFIAMNFTGNSTYTSLSGVKKEMKIAVPLQAIAAVAGLGLWIAGLFV